jgi:hypothetical protein
MMIIERPLDEPGRGGVDGEDDRGDHERGGGAARVHELDRGQGADRGAAHAGPEHAHGEAAPLRREPGVDERHPDGERGAADAEEEPADQQPGERGVAGQAQVEHRHHGGQRDRREHHPPAEAVGERADRDPPERADHDRDRDQQRLLERAEVQRVLEPRTEGAQQGPGPEVDREPDRGHGQHQGLLSCHAARISRKGTGRTGTFDLIIPGRFTWPGTGRRPSRR